jgi:hypothetical protein
MGLSYCEMPLYQKTLPKQGGAREARTPNHKKNIAASLLMGIGYNLENTLPNQGD